MNEGTIRSKAILDVCSERILQIGKGYDAAHDDEHAKGELLYAGVVHTLPYLGPITLGQLVDVANRLWPWSHKYQKSCDRRRDLVIAASYLVAEIERLDRATGSEAKP